MLKFLRKLSERGWVAIGREQTDRKPRATYALTDVAREIGIEPLRAWIANGDPKDLRLMPSVHGFATTASTPEIMGRGRNTLTP